MAANDKYVNSEGLNVNKEHEMERKTQKKTSRVISDTRIEMTTPTNSISTTSSEGQSVSAPTNHMKMGQHHSKGLLSSSSSSSSSSLNTPNETPSVNHRTTSNLSSVSTPQSYMLDSVAQVLNNPGYITKKKIPQRSLPPMNSRVSTNNPPNIESDDKDPIMKMMTETEKAHILESDEDEHNDDDTNIPPQTRKDPNRFLMDLDARMSVEIKNTPVVVQNVSEDYDGKHDPIFDLSKNAMTFQSLSKFGQSMASWVGITRNSASTFIQTSSSPSTSTSSERETLTYSQPNHDEETGVKVSSSAFLGDAEAAELLRIQQRNSDMILIVKRFLEEGNKKHLLYLGIFVLLYLWTRGR